MPRIKDTDYLQISARIRAMETRLLTKDRQQLMIEARSLKDAVRVLSECGYSDLDSGNYENVLAQAQKEVFSDLASACPAAEMVDYFRVKYDYHNLKTLIKGEALGLDVGRLLSDSGRVPAKTVADAISLNDLSRLPDDMSSSATQAREVLATSADPQLCDLVLDKACFEQMNICAASCGSSFLQGYFRITVDAINLKTIVRIRRMNKGPELLRQALVDGGSITSLYQQALVGKSVEEIFNGTALQSAASAAAEGQTALELQCDNAVADHLRSARMIPFGDAVVVAYLAAKEAEMTAVRTILAGKAAGIPGDQIRERLRDSYV